ncbi:hypothetical protein [Streptomyces flavofungini]|uniref:hypothetical protein n=1 Tax=Streptomyces flavofungini TaxID=68200 RepID=UPI0025AFD21D|nr:hypothetical protein [Streptomyces flavofungini]WJV47740.1 hypothetical protein QUY26_20780 [Streptomyces flavofungini]
MWSRARLAWRLLVGVLVVVLGVGVLCGSAGAAGATGVSGATGVPGAMGVPGAVVSSGAVSAGGTEAPVFVAERQGVPGCGQGGDKGDVQRPAAPPRSPTSYELLPALYDTRAGTCSWVADQAFLILSPGRAPPALVPPSPMDLSVLRV